MTLQEAKDQVAMKEGHADWMTCCFRENTTSMEFIMGKVAILYAREACREQREKCANAFNKSDGPVIGSEKISNAIINAPEPPLL